MKRVAGCNELPFSGLQECVDVAGRIEDGLVISPPGGGGLPLEDAYREHFPALMRVAYLMTGSNADAEDLVHDVFVRCAGRLEVVADPRSYLRAAVVNACRRNHRRAQSVPMVGLRGNEPSEPEPATAAAIAVQRALMAMKGRRRAAVVLRFYEDLSHSEIASVIGCREATARSLVHRGLADLREVLDER